MEVLLATALLAAGLALAFATLRAATATVNRGEQIAQRNERMRAVDGFLRQRLASALPLAYRIDPTDGRQWRFSGNDAGLQFVADLPEYLGVRGGPHLHSLQAVQGRDGARLQVGFALVQAGQTVAGPVERPDELLADGLRAVVFAYRGLDAENRLGAWQSQWNEVDRLPLQVSIRIVPEQGSPWPELVVALPQGGASPGQSLESRR